MLYLGCFRIVVLHLSSVSRFTVSLLFTAANLLLDYTAQRLKLTDFGFAQILDQYSSEVQSDENAGTLSYNPPEVYLG